ncbi:MAG: flavodoxin family protein [Planctomycetes bacterium]|nr:flavodoxin family protein [Planctomycetota bacterium]
MNVLILQGSPRKGGNTETVCSAMAEAMVAAGAKVESLRVADMNIGGCISCFACQKVGDAPGCSVKDDMQQVYAKILAADLVVLATPVYCWGMTAQIKAPIDRFYAFGKFAFQTNGQHGSLVEGKATALVVTAGGGHYDGAELCVAAFRAKSAFMRMDNRGEFVAAPLGEPKATAADQRLLDKAAEFGRAIVKG